MKMDAVLSFVLSILEGGLAGAYFYRAGRAEERKHKVFYYMSAAWFVLSVLNGVAGTRALREAGSVDVENIPD